MSVSRIEQKLNNVAALKARSLSIGGISCGTAP